MFKKQKSITLPWSKPQKKSHKKGVLMVTGAALGSAIIAGFLSQKDHTP